MALSGGIVLEEAVDLSSDRLLMNECPYHLYNYYEDFISKNL
jgi:hypothetical protein